MRLLVGLGNPGNKYNNTRHNVGFMVIDAFAAKVNSEGWSLNGKLHSLLSMVDGSLVLAKPNIFMNSSGKAILPLVNYYKILAPDIWVIHDDLEIILGHYKIQNGIGQ